MSAERFHGKRKTPVWHLTCKCHVEWCRTVLAVELCLFAATCWECQWEWEWMQWFCYKPLEWVDFTSGADRITQEVKVEPGNPVTTVNIFSPLNPCWNWGGNVLKSVWHLIRSWQLWFRACSCLGREPKTPQFSSPRETCYINTDWSQWNVGIINNIRFSSHKAIQ